MLTKSFRKDYPVFSSLVEDLLTKFSEVGSNFQMVVDLDQRGLDQLTINMEVTVRKMLSEKESSNHFTKKVRENLKSVLGVTPKEINLMEPDSLPRAADSQFTTASHRVVDKRDIYKVQ
jgi:phenylacetate-coenzyme A ligase PaaK-like adenylate-forming protein